ncbi:MAG: GGDEF domain-containing protein [Nitrosomonas sp.]|nr:GGDEF domain-containing protein [Nitrosomonas sp.]
MSSQRYTTASYFRLFLNEFSDRIHYVIMLAVMIGIFIFDLLSPLGVAAGSPYVLVVFGSLWIKGKTATYIAAVMSLFLIIVGFFLSSFIVSPMETVIINRLLAALLVVGAALIVIRIKKTDDKLSVLKAQTIIDPLTQTRNLRAFELELGNEILRHKRYARSLSVAFIDIDYLSKINQDYGRSGGDDVINRVAKEIGNNIRSCDVLYRLTGDRFAVLFAETGMRDTKRVAEAICKKVTDNIETNDRKITLSMGIATLEEKDSRRLLCQRVEEALLQSKEEGKNRVTTVPPISSKDTPRIAAILTRSRY